MSTVLSIQRSHFNVLRLFLFLQKDSLIWIFGEQAVAQAVVICEDQNSHPGYCKVVVFCHEPARSGQMPPLFLYTVCAWFSIQPQK